MSTERKNIEKNKRHVLGHGETYIHVYWSGRRECDWNPTSKKYDAFF